MPIIDYELNSRVIRTISITEELKEQNGGLKNTILDGADDRFKH